MTDLISRLEAAEGPSRELDYAVFEDLGAPLPKSMIGVNVQLQKVGDHYAVPVSEDLQVRYEPPEYTSSIDAALTLAPSGLRLQLSDWDHDKLRERGPWQAILSNPGCRDTFEVGYRCDHAATPALAICIAALKARGGE